MTDAGQDRYDLLRDAIAANPGAQWTTATAISLFRADGVTLDYWLAAQDEVAA